MNYYCPSVHFIRLCWLTEARTCQGVRKPTKDLVIRTQGQYIFSK